MRRMLCDKFTELTLKPVVSCTLKVKAFESTTLFWAHENTFHETKLFEVLFEKFLLEILFLEYVFFSLYNLHDILFYLDK